MELEQTPHPRNWINPFDGRDQSMTRPCSPPTNPTTKTIKTNTTGRDWV
jgi:hypothetical protein